MENKILYLRSISEKQLIEEIGLALRELEKRKQAPMHEGAYFYQLFSYFYEKFNLMLTAGEIQDIVNRVNDWQQSRSFAEFNLEKDIPPAG